MKVTTRHALALLALLATATQASAGSATLAELIAGGSLNSDSGSLSFTNFTYTPSGLGGAPLASNVNVVTSENGLAFFSAVTVGPGNVTDFVITYDVLASDDCVIVSASQSSIAAASGAGSVGLAEVLTDGASGNLLNLYTDSFTQTEDTATFDATSSLSVKNNIGLLGPAFLSDFNQDFGVECNGTPIPTPTAALAGLALLGLVTRRRRGL